MSKREEKTWWVVSDGAVVQAVGKSCAPDCPEYWWCPSLGVTRRVGEHLFESKREAVAKALQEMHELKAVTQNKIDKLLVERL